MEGEHGVYPQKFALRSPTGFLLRPRPILVAMSKEQVLQDFTAGMNALAQVDALATNECLLAENVRLEKVGSIQSAGALTHQNTSAYAATAGTSTKSVHSLYWNPSLGAVAGVGQDIFIGKTLSGMKSGLAAKNTSQQKIGFASAPNRVYFDVGNISYWSDASQILAVDWPPPATAGATVTGPTTVGTGTQTSGGGLQTIAWLNPNNVTSTNTAIFAEADLTNFADSQLLRATMSTNSFGISANTVSGIVVTLLSDLDDVSAGAEIQATLLRSGVPVGNTKSLVPAINFNTNTFGGSSDLWGATWAQGDINAGTFGVQIAAVSTSAVGVKVCEAQITVYQGAGFSAAAGAAGALTGTYTWKVTFVAANGEESDASGASASVTLSAQQGTLTGLPAGDARTTGRNIYRKGNSMTSYYLVGSIQDNISTTYSDNQTDAAALSQGDILAGDVPGDSPNTRLGSQQVRFPCYHYDRVFWIVPGTNEIIWSKPLNGFAYPVVNSINIGDSKPCTRLVSIFGELIIFKTDSIWRLTGTDESSFDLSQTPSAVGTDEPFTIWAQADGVRFANRWGLWLFNGYTSQPLTNKLDLWFKQDDRTGVSLFGANGFHPPEVSSASVVANFEAVGNGEKWVWTYAEAGQSSNNAILVLDLKHGNITKRSLGTNLPLSLAIDPVTGFVYVGDNQGFVSLLDDWNGATQAGSNANFDFQTGYIDPERGSNKVIWSLEFYGDLHGQTLTPTIYYDNGASSETLATISWTGLQRKIRPLELGKSRLCQNFSVRLNGSLTSVNASGTPQIQMNHIKVYYDVRVGRARTGQTS